MNTSRRTAQRTSLLAVALCRSFSRSTMGLRLTQDMPPNQSGKSWVNTSCFAIAVLGLGLSFFSTRQLYGDPKRQCLLWKK